MVEKQPDSLILAAPERKRILRELLNRPEPWSAADRILYHQILRMELYRSWKVDDVAEAHLEKEIFVDLVCKGATPDRALDRAREVTREALREKTKGQKERERRRAYREAVTAARGAEAVTLGRVDECIICGKPLPGGPIRRGGMRADAAYCGNACRQKAYRRRRKMVR